MPRRRPLPIALVLTVATLAGCNARAPGAVATSAPAPARSGAAAPEGPGCAAALARYRSVIENDLSMGHVNRGVYDQIQREIGEAQSACAAGQDGRALSLLQSSKSRHGYPG